MTVTEESGGRLNAFAKEPEIEVITSKSFPSNDSRQFILIGTILFIGIIGVYWIIK